MTYLTTEERAAAVASMTPTPAPTPAPTETPAAETPTPTPEAAKPAETPTPEPTPTPTPDPAIAKLSDQHEALLGKIDTLVEKLTPAQQAAAAAAETPKEREGYFAKLAEDPEASEGERAAAKEILKRDEQLEKISTRLDATEKRLAERQEQDAVTAFEEQLEAAAVELLKTYNIPEPALAKIFEWIGDEKNAAAVPHLTLEDVAVRVHGREFLGAHARKPATPGGPKPTPNQGPSPANVVAETTPGGGAAIPNTPVEVPGVGGIRSATMDILANHKHQLGKFE